MTSNLISFIKKTLNYDEDKAIDFIEEFWNNNYCDTFDLAFAKFRSYFPDTFVADTDTQIEIGRLISEGKLKDKEIKKLFKARFKEFNSADLDHSVFEGKTFVPHIKDTAEPFAKRCNGVFCEVILYNDDFIYVKNKADGKIYIISTEDFAD